MTEGKDEPLIVDELRDLPPAASGRWVFVRETTQLYVESDGEWVPYVEPPAPNLWSLLEDE